MTRDDVMRMAAEAGFGRIFPAAQGLPATWYGTDPDRLLAFAALVAADENEACAKAAEAFHRHGYDFTGNLELHEWLRSRPTGHKEST